MGISYARKRWSREGFRRRVGTRVVVWLCGKWNGESLLSWIRRSPCSSAGSPDPGAKCVVDWVGVVSYARLNVDLDDGQDSEGGPIVSANWEADRRLGTTLRVQHPHRPWRRLGRMATGWGGTWNGCRRGSAGRMMRGGDAGDEGKQVVRRVLPVEVGLAAEQIDHRPKFRLGCRVRRGGGRREVACGAYGLRGTGDEGTSGSSMTGLAVPCKPETMSSPDQVSRH